MTKKQKFFIWFWRVLAIIYFITGFSNHGCFVFAAIFFIFSLLPAHKEYKEAKKEKKAQHLLEKQLKKQEKKEQKQETQKARKEKKEVKKQAKQEKREEAKRKWEEYLAQQAEKAERMKQAKHDAEIDRLWAAEREKQAQAAPLATAQDVLQPAVETPPEKTPAASDNAPDNLAQLAYEKAAAAARPAQDPARSFDISNEYKIVYSDSEGNITRRDISLQGFLRNKYGFYIMAFCHLREAMRQFTVSNIKECWHDGEEIKNPYSYFKSMYENSAEYKTTKALDEHFDQIMTMIFMARADGKMMKNEREVILRYLDSVSPGIDAAVAEEVIKKTKCELAEFNAILKKAAAWTTGEKEKYVSCARQIFQLKKNPDPMEKVAYEKVLAAIK